MTRIALRPVIAFAGTAPPGAEELQAIHHEAHDKCYIANTLNCDVVVEAP